VRLKQFVSNIISQEDGSKIEGGEGLEGEKDVYDYDDIVEMKLDNKKFIVNKVLGQKFFIIENEYPFVVNPYDVKRYDSFLERNSRKSFLTAIGPEPGPPLQARGWRRPRSPLGQP
jgi:hypothetical protein